MDQTQLQQKIVEYFQKLPKEAQEVFSSMVWMEKLKEISLNYHLTEEQIKTLGTETTLVLLGIIEVAEYQNILKKELGLEKVVAEKIISELDQNVLGSIKTHLETAFKQNSTDLVEKTYGGDKKLDERFASLPKEIQVIINESNFQPTLYAIAKKYKLTIDQMGILEEVTTKILLGIIHPDKYQAELADKTSIPAADITNIVLDVNEEILKTIRQALKKHWDDKDKIENEKEDIPLPPYAIPEVKKTPMAKWVLPEVAKVEPEVYEIPKHRETIESLNLENNVPSPDKNIFANKLNGVTASDHKTTDYTMPKMTTSKIDPTVDPQTDKAAPRNDPYREIF